MTGDSPAPPALRPVARAVEPIYRGVVTRRNARFDRGLGVVTLDRPVISIGNLTVGGTGKTPMVDRVVRWLIEDGRHPAIAMRGYRAGPDGVSDEARLYHDAFEGVPVVTQPNRVEGLLALFSTELGERIDVVVLDDGFQHRRLARQLDLVLVDATHDVFADRCLPAGWLREPVESLARAGGVVLTHADRAEPGALTCLRGSIHSLAGMPVLAEARHAWRGLDVFEGGEPREEPVSWLDRRSVLAVCAIGKPRSFFEACERAGATVTHRVELRDHDPYAETTIRRILHSARDHAVGAIVTTAKDWVKLRRVRPGVWPAPIARPRLSLDFESGEADLHSLVLLAAETDPDEPAVVWHGSRPTGPTHDRFL